MSTRAQVRFATRETGITFSEHPNAIHAQFYVHSDGYPEGLGVEIAESLEKYTKIMGFDTLVALCTAIAVWIIGIIECSKQDKYKE